ncbi:MAG: peptidylprolyl isomerase [Pseudomonadota bacterium]
MENERASLLAGLAVAELAQRPVNEEDVQAAYDSQFGDFEGTPEFNASHILVETEEEAQALIEELEGGADFAEVAMRASIGPSAPRGGELGWFQEGMMVPPFQAAVAELEVGEISAPVETQFGWHVIKLNDKRAQAAPTLEEVRSDIEGQLRSAALEATLADLVGSAEVERADGIDPNILNTIRIFGQ